MPGSDPSCAAAVRGRLLVLAVPKGQHVVVLVAGEADRATSLELREKLVDSLFYRPRSLVVDATDLTCDAHGLDALLDFVALAEVSGTHVTIRPSLQLARRMADRRPAPRTSGQVAPDPAACPLPRPSPQTA